MPTRFGKAEISRADKTLAKALSHPVRAQALTILNARVASPSEIAEELELPLGNVAYHVNELEKFGCVELVRTVPKRGATEHFYRGVAQKYLSDDFFGKAQLLRAKQPFDDGHPNNPRCASRLTFDWPFRQEERPSSLGRHLRA